MFDYSKINAAIKNDKSIDLSSLPELKALVNHFAGASLVAQNTVLTKSEHEFELNAELVLFNAPSPIPIILTVELESPDLAMLTITPVDNSVSLSNGIQAFADVTGSTLDSDFIKAMDFANVHLQKLDVLVSASHPRPLYLRVCIGLGSKYAIVPNMLEISDVVVGASIYSGVAYSEYSVSGRLTLDSSHEGEPVVIDLEAHHANDYAFIGHLHEGSTIPLSDAIASITHVPDLPAVTLDTLEVYATNEGTIHISAGCSSGWKLPLVDDKTLDIEHFSFQLWHQQDQFTFNVEGVLGIAGVDFVLSANKGEAQSGWVFEGRAAQETPLKLGQWLDSAAHEIGPVSLPHSVQTLEVSDVDLVFSSGEKSVDLTMLVHSTSGSNNAAINQNLVTLAHDHALQTHTNAVTLNKMQLELQSKTRSFRNRTLMFIIKVVRSLTSPVNSVLSSILMALNSNCLPKTLKLAGWLVPLQQQVAHWATLYERWRLPFTRDTPVE